MFSIFFLLMQGVMYSSVELSPPSGLVGHDDLHKTQYSTLQQKAQEESSFNEGKECMCIIGSVYNETVIDM